MGFQPPRRHQPSSAITNRGKSQSMQIKRIQTMIAGHQRSYENQRQRMVSAFQAQEGSYQNQIQILKSKIEDQKRYYENQIQQISIDLQICQQQNFENEEMTNNLQNRNSILGNKVCVLTVIIVSMIAFFFTIVYLPTGPMKI